MVLLKIEFEDMHSDRPLSGDYAEMLNAITGNLRIVVDGRVLFDDHEFPVLELAYQLHVWMRDRMSLAEPFKFTSMMIEDDGWVWIEPALDGWRVGSILERFSDISIYSSKHIRTMISEFVDSAILEAESVLGGRISWILGAK